MYYTIIKKLNKRVFLTVTLFLLLQRRSKCKTYHGNSHIPILRPANVCADGNDNPNAAKSKITKVRQSHPGVY